MVMLKIIRSLTLMFWETLVCLKLPSGFPFKKHSKFEENVKLAKEMGLDHVKASFVFATHVLINFKRAKWESRIEAGKKWDWSHEISFSVLVKCPALMLFASIFCGMLKHVQGTNYCSIFLSNQISLNCVSI